MLAGSLKGATLYGGESGGSDDGADLVSIEQGITSGVVYGNQGQDTVFVNAGGAAKSSVYGGAGNDSLNINAGGADSLLYAGGLGADSVQVTGGLTSSTVYGDSAGASVGGADSISVAGNASGSYIYGNVGDDRVSLAAGLIAVRSTAAVTTACGSSPV